MTMSVVDNPGAATGLPAGVQGDVLYHNGVAWVVLNAGAVGWVLGTQGPGVNPAWQAPAAGGTFIGHADTPGAYAGAAGQLLRINLAANAVEFSDVVSDATVIVAASNSTAAEQAAALASGGTVCTGANDEVDLQAQVVANTKLLLTSGTYAIDAQLDIGVDDFVLEGLGPGVTILQRGAGPLNIDMVEVTTSRVIIRGITFDGNGASASRLRAAIYCNGSDHVLIEHNELFNISLGVFLTSALESHYCMFTTIQNNHMHTLYFSGVAGYDGVQYLYCINNEVHFIRADDEIYGMYVTGFGDRDTNFYLTQHIWYIQNQIYDLIASGANDGEGLNCEAATHVHAIQNEIWDCDQGIYFQCRATINDDEEMDYTIIHNRITGRSDADASDWGIRVEAISGGSDEPAVLRDVLIDGNSVQQYGDTAILVACIEQYAFMEHVNIINNFIWDHTGDAAGISLYVNCDHAGATLRYVNCAYNHIDCAGAIGNNSRGITFDGVYDSTITGNNVNNFDFYGIFVINNGAAVADNMQVIANRVFTAEGGRGIAIQGGDSMLVGDNRIIVNNFPILINSAITNALIRHNNWEDSSFDLEIAAAATWMPTGNIDVNGQWYLGPGEKRTYRMVVDHDGGSPIAICNVVPGFIVTDVYVRVIETFDGAATLQIGDGISNFGFLSSAGGAHNDINLGVAGYYGWDLDQREAYLWDNANNHPIHHLYNAGGDTVDAFVIVGGATQGQAEVFVRVISVNHGH